jgi:pimeloyl-ACP methyl ester carboxylesterase
MRLAVEEVGNGGDRLVVLVHGLLSTRTTWRYMAGDLGQDHHLMLVDMPGCGDSDKPDPDLMGAGGYSPSALARYVLAGVRERLAAGDAPDRIAVVGHSLGGAVVLRMMGDPELAEEYGDVLERIDRVVLVSPLEFAMEKADPAFTAIAEMGKLKVSLGKALGVLKNRIAKHSREGSNDPDRVPKEDAVRMIDAIRDPETRRAGQAMILQAVPYHVEEKRPNWAAIERLVADYENVEQPTLILWGARDEVLSHSSGYKLVQQLPQAWLRVFRESMHSLPIERPQLTATYVRDFLSNGGEGWSQVEEVELPAYEAQRIAKETEGDRIEQRRARSMDMARPVAAGRR